MIKNMSTLKYYFDQFYVGNARFIKQNDLFIDDLI